MFGHKQEAFDSAAPMTNFLESLAKDLAQSEQSGPVHANESVPPHDIHRTANDTMSHLSGDVHVQRSEKRGSKTRTMNVGRRTTPPAPVVEALLEDIMPPQKAPLQAKVEPNSIAETLLADTPQQQTQNNKPLPSARRNAALISKFLEQDAWMSSVPSAPIYTPTAEEWSDPLKYIRSKQAEAAAFGMCMVCAPVSPAVPASLALGPFKFNTREQLVRDADWGADWNSGVMFYESPKQYSLLDFQRQADEFARKKMGIVGNLPPRTIEAAYWHEREKGSTSHNATKVEYGNDLEGTAFYPEDPLGKTAWNLNTLPSLEGSALRWCSSAVPGVSTPMLYIGMLFSTFAWHVEDHNMFSINYQHAGAPKIWYGVPAAAADALEAVTADTVYKEAYAAAKASGSDEKECAMRVAEALMSKTTMMSPKILKEQGVPVYRAVQEVGCFVVTFPRAYHGGFSCGFNVGEAVNFATPEWWPFGEDSRRLYRRLGRQHILAHEQALCCDALDAAKHAVIHQGALRSPADSAMMSVFVSTVQRAHSFRRQIEGRGAITVLADASPGVAGLIPERECDECKQSCYLCSVIRSTDGVIEDWERLCLECAAEDETCGGTAVLLVHLQWVDAENAAHLFEPLIKPIEESALPLPLHGCSKTLNPDPMMPYEWTQLSIPRTSLPENIMKALYEPLPAPAAPTPAPNRNPFLKRNSSEDEVVSEDPQRDYKRQRSAAENGLLSSFKAPLLGELGNGTGTGNGTGGSSISGAELRRRRHSSGLLDSRPGSATSVQVQQSAFEEEQEPYSSQDFAKLKEELQTAWRRRLEIKWAINIPHEPLQEAPGSTPECRLYQHGDQVVVAASHALKYVFSSPTKKDSLPLSWLQGSVKALTASPLCNPHHVRAMMPVTAHLENWKSTSRLSWVLRLDQCAILTELKASSQVNKLRQLMVQVWGEAAVNEVCQMVMRVAAGRQPTSAAAEDDASLEPELSQPAEAAQELSKPASEAPGVPEVSHLKDTVEKNAVRLEGGNGGAVGGGADLPVAETCLSLPPLMDVSSDDDDIVHPPPGDLATLLAYTSEQDSPRALSPEVQENETKADAGDEGEGEDVWVSRLHSSTSETIFGGISGGYYMMPSTAHVAALAPAASTAAFVAPPAPPKALAVIPALLPAPAPLTIDELKDDMVVTLQQEVQPEIERFLPRVLPELMEREKMSKVVKYMNQNPKKTNQNF